VIRKDKGKKLPSTTETQKLLVYSRELAYNFASLIGQPVGLQSQSTEDRVDWPGIDNE
jgi:hypothetical protein